MKNLKILFILCLIWTACENEQISPSDDSSKQKEDDIPATEDISIQEKINGLWTLDKISTTICKVANEECNTMDLDAGASDYFKFSSDSVEYKIFDSVEKYPLEVVSDDTLQFNGHFISEYFIIENITENNLTISFYMDHSHENVNDDNDMTDLYYLSR